MKISELVKNIREKPFIKSIIRDLGGEIFLVGGIVRDSILNKHNKDIDLVVRLVDINKLIYHLKRFGKVDVVGKSFGVIKFIANDDGLDYDIALPRTETSIGGGHTDFDVNFNENLPIEDDLIRRDSKINSMAININKEEFIDPFGGLNDIKNNQMSMTNPDAFADDPLRMLRAVQFASRFDFTIEPTTMKAIKANADKIVGISAERILGEFDKIVKKGDALVGAMLLRETGLFEKIFGKSVGFNKVLPWDAVQTMGEFIYLLTNKVTESPAEFYKRNLKGDIDTYKELKALEYGFSNVSDDVVKNRAIVSMMNGVSPNSINSGILPKQLKNPVIELKSGKYPLSLKQLAVNGNDLMALGLKGQEIGQTLKSLLINVYGDKVKNDKEELLNFLNQNNKPINEAKEMNRVSYSAVVLDSKSRSKLLDMIGGYIPKGWEIVAHHMTINMGEIKPEYEKYLGMKVNLRTIKMGLSDMAMAVMVEGFPTNNDIPHITIAVNRAEGGKPFMSNKIKNWRPMQFAVEMTGIVTEVT